METPTKAAIYARTATVQERGETFAMSEQVRQCMELAAKQGYEVVDVYEEVGSGLSATRAGLNALLQAAKEGKFAVVIILDSARLARRPNLVTAILAELETCGVTVESVREPFAGDTDLSMFVHYVQAMVSDLERQKITHRQQHGRQVKKQREVTKR